MHLSERNMERALGHANALRAVGRIFDAEAARSVLIEERTDSIWLSWDGRQGSGKTARYPWVELDRMERTAQTDRTSSSMARLVAEHKDARAWSELLRTVGQNLDEEAADTSTITGDLNWITVSWVCDGNFMTKQYTAGELWESSRLRASLHQRYP